MAVSVQRDTAVAFGHAPEAEPDEVKIGACKRHTALALNSGTEFTFSLKPVPASNSGACDMPDRKSRELDIITAALPRCSEE